MLRGNRYRDPLDEIWVSTARRIGFTVTRTRDAYARVERGVIHIGEDDLLDPDDSLAQMILHELCHALVEGEDAWRAEDWGLDNQSDRDEAREHACLRLQAALAGAHGLRRFLAATTEYRVFYDALPDEPLGTDAAARAGLARSRRAPFAPHLEAALAATARIAVEAARAGPEPGSLYATVEVARHSTGLALGRDGTTCGGCAWFMAARGRCRQTGTRVRAEERACARWEGELDCQTCGACCIDGGFDAVPVTPRDKVVRRHPELVLARDGALELRRAGGRCAALRSTDGGHHTCVVYEDRPRTCRDFPRSGQSCLEARRRLGLTA